MKQLTKGRILGMLFCLIMMTGLMPVTAFAAEEEVIISEENFPDPKFREYLLGLDAGKDGMFTAGEISDITKISCSMHGISDLTGIGYFTQLEELDISVNCVHALDLRQNSRIYSLDISVNPIACVAVHENVSNLALTSGGESIQHFVKNGAPLTDICDFFDVEKVRDLKGGTFENEKVNFNSNTYYIEYQYVVYTYDNDKEKTVLCRLWRGDTAKVTFHVDNGTWNQNDRDCVDKSVIINLKDGKGTLESSAIPSGFPDEGYQDGHWEVQPDTGTDKITGDVTYNYIFEKEQAALSVDDTKITELDKDFYDASGDWVWIADEKCLYLQKRISYGDKLKISAVNMGDISLCYHKKLDINNACEISGVGTNITKRRFVNVDLELANCKLTDGATAPRRLIEGSRYAAKLNVEPEQYKDIAISIEENGKESVVSYIELKKNPDGTEVPLLGEGQQWEDDITIRARGRKTRENLVNEACSSTEVDSTIMTLYTSDLSRNPKTNDWSANCLCKAVKLGTLEKGSVIGLICKKMQGDDVEVFLAPVVNGKFKTFSDSINCFDKEQLLDIEETGEYYLFFTTQQIPKDEQLGNSFTVDIKNHTPKLDLTKDPVPGADGRWTWDRATKTLTLKDGFHCEGDGPALYAKGDLKIVVEKGASVSISSETMEGIKVSDGNLSILLKPGSTLNIKAKKEGIFAYYNEDNFEKGSIEIRGEKENGKLPKLKINSTKEAGLKARGNITAIDCELDLVVHEEGLFCSGKKAEKKLYLKNCRTKIKSKDEEGIDSNDIIIEGGSLIIDADSYALEADKNIVFRNSPVLDIWSDVNFAGMGVINEEFTFPGEIQLLGKNKEIVYVGKWDEGVKNGNIKFASRGDGSLSFFVVEVNSKVVKGIISSDPGYCVHNAVMVPGQAATSTADGWENYYRCAICNRLFADAACTVEITDLAAWKNGDGKLGAISHTDDNRNDNDDTAGKSGNGDDATPDSGQSTSSVKLPAAKNAGDGQLTKPIGKAAKPGTDGTGEKKEDSDKINSLGSTDEAGDSDTDTDANTDTDTDKESVPDVPDEEMDNYPVMHISLGADLEETVTLTLGQDMENLKRENFKSLTVDGELVEEGEDTFTLGDSGIKIEFASDFLKKLGTGDYKIVVTLQGENFEDVPLAATLSLTEEETEETVTREIEKKSTSIPLVVTGIIVILMAVAAACFVKFRNRENQ